MISLGQAARPAGAVAALTLAALASSAPAQAAPAATVVSNADAIEIVDRVSDALRDGYPLAQVARLYVAALAKGHAARRYHGLEACQLAERLTADLNAAHRDVHLHLSCGAQAKAETAPNAFSPPDSAAHGIDGVSLSKDMPLALVRSSGPWDTTQDSFEVAAAAMSMAVRAKYVIIDVRDNPGGHGAIGVLMASYFYPVGEDHPLVVGIFRDRSRDTPENTFPFTPGPRAPDAKLYILVNHGTGSAAEGFAFGLQRAGRATVIGQTTAGAGIAGDYLPLKDGLVAFIPTKLIVAPSTMKGWEGVGVTPDIVTAPGEEQQKAFDLVAQDLRAKGEMDGPEVLGMPPGRSIVLGPKLDVSQAATAPATGCQHKAVDLAVHQITITNGCGSAVTLQYVSSDKPAVVYQTEVPPGFAMRTRYFGDRPGYWWIWAVCPSGYFAKPSLTGADQAAFDSGAYRCARP